MGAGGGEYIVVRGDEWKIYHPGFFSRLILVCEVRFEVCIFWVSV
jgi:hypothetical protein